MNDKELYDACHRLFSYDADTGLVVRKVTVSGVRSKAGAVIGCVNDRGYLLVWINGKSYRVHRLIWLMVTGLMPKEHIDHINGIKTDNRFANLREATHAENQQNRGKQRHNKSGFKGVVTISGANKNPYLARIASGGKVTTLGYFPTPELAHEAYCAASAKLHGDFGRVV